MTCARVREFNSKPPPQVSILPEILNTQTQEKKTTDDGPKTYFRTVLNHNNAGKEPEQSLRKKFRSSYDLYFCFFFLLILVDVIFMILKNDSSCWQIFKYSL